MKNNLKPLTEHVKRNNQTKSIILNKHIKYSTKHQLALDYRPRHKITPTIYLNYDIINHILNTITKTIYKYTKFVQNKKQNIHYKVLLNIMQNTHQNNLHKIKKIFLNASINTQQINIQTKTTIKTIEKFTKSNYKINKLTLSKSTKIKTKISNQTITNHITTQILLIKHHKQRHIPSHMLAYNNQHFTTLSYKTTYGLGLLASPQNKQRKYLLQHNLYQIPNTTTTPIHHPNLKYHPKLNYQLKFNPHSKY